MPAAIESPPPTSPPPSGVTIVGEKPPAPPPKPTTTIRASEIAPTATPAESPKRGSARDKLFENLRSKAKPTNAPEPEQTPKPVTQPESEKAPETTPESEDVTPKDRTETTTAPVTESTDKDKKKTNPWKLVEQYKNRIGELEKQFADAKTSSLAEADRKSLTERAEKAEAKLKQFEEESRILNYSKTDEFKQKYDVPYEQAWKRAMEEIRELTITDANSGDTRPVTVQDMMQLVNMPLGRARDIADQLFGKFADDVMAHRKEILGVFGAKQAALEEAKTKAGEWEKQQQQKLQEERAALEKKTAEMREFVKQEWESANKAVLDDPEYGEFFKEREGDAEWNQRLAKGTELVNRAFSENPADPKLTPDQRKLVIKRHAAVRNRARAFGAIRDLYKRTLTKLEEANKQIAEFKQSEPTTEGGGGTTTTTGPIKARDEVIGALRKLAK